MTVGRPEVLKYGALEAPTLDLTHRPYMQNDDGYVSTVRSMGITENDGKDYLLPTVNTRDGHIMGDDEAVDEFRRTGEHMGVYASPEASDSAGERIHLEQMAKPPIDTLRGKGMRWGTDQFPKSAPESLPYGAPADVKGQRGLDAPAEPEPSWLDRLSGLRDNLVGKRDRDAPRDQNKRHRAAIQGAVHGGTLGFADELGELVEPGAGDVMRADEQTARTEDPNAFLAGDIAGGVAAGEGVASGVAAAGRAAAPVIGAMTAAAPKTAQAARIVAEGAGENVAQSVGDQTEGSWWDKLANSKQAGLWGAAIPVAGMAAGKLGKKAAADAPYFYHTTDAGNLSDIQKHGLDPARAGQNWNAEADKGKTFFADEKSLPFWHSTIHPKGEGGVEVLRTRAKAEPYTAGYAEEGAPSEFVRTEALPPDQLERFKRNAQTDARYEAELEALSEQRAAAYEKEDYTEADALNQQYDALAKKKQFDGDWEPLSSPEDFGLDARHATPPAPATIPPHAQSIPPDARTPAPFDEEEITAQVSRANLLDDSERAAREARFKREPLPDPSMERYRYETEKLERRAKTVPPKKRARARS